MIIDLAKSHFGSLSHNIPEVKLSNLYVVDNPLSATQTSYVTRPVLSSFVDMGQTVRGIFYQQGFNNDNLLVVAGNSLFSVAPNGAPTNLGAIAGTGTCEFASTIYGVCVVTNGLIYYYNGVSLFQVSTLDGLLVSSVASLNNYFIFSFQGSGRFYWLKPGQTSFDLLSFASAEANPDYIMSVRTTSDELWLIGNTTTEVWAPSPDQNAPFIRITGRIFNQGCAAVTSVAQGVFNSLPCLLWVSDTREVILAQGFPKKISNDYVEEMMKASAYYYCWFFRRHRNDFYVISTDVITLVYDLSNKFWYKWTSGTASTWKISTGVQKQKNLYGVNLLKSSLVYTLEEGLIDANADSLICEVTGFVFNTENSSIPCSVVDVVANPGYASSYTTSPAIELRTSDNQGQSWSAYVSASLGPRGGDDNLIRFRSLGVIKSPGRRFEFRFSLAESFRIDYILMNLGK